LLPALLSQENPHWRAYFLVTDEKPFQAELTSILSSYGDSRLQYLDIPMAYRPAVSALVVSACLHPCVSVMGISWSRRCMGCVNSANGRMSILQYTL
jgi:hypothetical protein